MCRIASIHMIGNAAHELTAKQLVAFSQSDSSILSKIAKIGWIVYLIGTALWLYGYFSIGSPPGTPWWIADLFPNTEADWGIGLMLYGTAPTYWPAH